MSGRVQLCSCEEVGLRRGVDGNFDELVATTGGLRTKTLRLSCQSDRYAAGKQYAGFILFGYRGQASFTINGHRVQCGYVAIVESSRLQRYTANWGQVHGKAFEAVFGLQEYPVGLVGEGFSITPQGELHDHSLSFNVRDDGHHNSLNAVHPTTRLLLEELVKSWKRGTVAPGTTVPVADLVPQRRPYGRQRAAPTPPVAPPPRDVPRRAGNAYDGWDTVIVLGLCLSMLVMGSRSARRPS